MSSSSSSESLTDLPLEVLTNILCFLDVPALLQISRTSHLLRTLSLDPLIQRARLVHARHDLNILLLHRLPKSYISPPNAWIWLSQTNVISRSISKSLIRIRLNHTLQRRPPIDHLLERAIVPEYYSRMFTGAISPVIAGKLEDVRKSRLKDKLGRLLQLRPNIDRMVELNIMPVECGSRSMVSPGLVETRRRVMKETLKDGLRSWLKNRALIEQKRKEEAYDDTTTGVNVQAIVRRLSACKIAREDSLGKDHVEKRRFHARWGRELQIQRRKEERRLTAFGVCSQPTRAHVLGLKRFWEDVISTAAG